jgi:tetratricopeptide (TPR) repeat protein
MMKARSLLVGFALLALASTAAAAEPSPAQVDQARMLFSAGAKAYEGGQFNAAIQAFEDANKIVPKPQIVFSIAQAHRRQYYVAKEPEHLREAIRRYREYVEAVKEGGRVSDAAQALAELEPLASRTAVDQAPRPVPKDPARIMVMTQIDATRVTIDGAAAKAGLAVEVKPGKHHVSTTADGYFPDERDIQAVDNALVPVDVSLREKPAHLTVVGGAGAQVAVDGRPAGTTPLASPVEVPPGTHLVTIMQSGHVGYSQELDLTRDQKKQLAVELPDTTQRKVSYAMMIGGGAVILAGGVFTGAALVNQSDAQKIQDRRTNGTISQGDAGAYDAARSHRDDWTKASIVAYSVGGAAALAGVALFLFDPPAAAVPPRLDDRPKKPEPAKPAPGREPMEMSFTPLVGPGLGGAGVRGVF